MENTVLQCSMMLPNLPHYKQFESGNCVMCNWTQLIGPQGHVVAKYHVLHKIRVKWLGVSSVLETPSQLV